MSRVESPREYRARIFSSNPTNRRWRFLTIFGSKLPSRSRGVSIPTGPCSVYPFRGWCSSEALNQGGSGEGAGWSWCPAVAALMR